jgi:hypothetical protein
LELAGICPRIFVSAGEAWLTILKIAPTSKLVIISLLHYCGGGSRRHADCAAALHRAGARRALNRQSFEHNSAGGLPHKLLDSSLIENLHLRDSSNLDRVELGCRVVESAGGFHCTFEGEVPLSVGHGNASVMSTAQSS